EAADSGPRAKERLNEAVTRQYGSPQTMLQPQTAQYLAQLVQGLIRHKELVEAKRQLERLAELEKQRKLPEGALASVDLRARLLEAEGERDKALDLLRAYVKRPGGRPQDAA